MKLQFAVVTLFPDMLEAVREQGVTGRAVKSGIIGIEAWNPRDYAEDKHRSVDDRPYGGGPGMVMLPSPLCAAIRAARDTMPAGAKVIHLTPQGRLLDQDGVMELATRERLILVAGRYEYYVLQKKAAPGKS